MFISETSKRLFLLQTLIFQARIKKTNKHTKKNRDGILKDNISGRRHKTIVHLVDVHSLEHVLRLQVAHQLYEVTSFE